MHINNKLRHVKKKQKPTLTFFNVGIGVSETSCLPSLATK